MKGVHLPVGRRLFVALIVLVTLVALFPLRLALPMLGLDRSGLTVRQVHETIWWGALEQAKIGDVDLGNLEVGLKPLPLFIGRGDVWFRRVGKPEEALSGTLSAGHNRIAVKQLTGVTPVGASLGVLPVSALQWDGADILFVDKACRDARGRVRALLGGSLGAMPLSAGMNGALSCEGRRLAINFTGENGVETLKVLVDADGRYEGQLGFRTNNDAVRAALAAQGFAPMGDGVGTTIKGRF